MSDEVRLKQERPSACLTLEVAVAVVHIPLVQQKTLLPSKLRRTFRTPENRR